MTSGISQRTFCIAISTHTLTWSVTTAELEKNISDIISTHTLTWSVTGFLSLLYWL